jgi:hypothetical protein
MGLLIKDTTTFLVLVHLNTRFGEGDALREMVALQKEFQIFSSKHSLRYSFALLNIAPSDWSERERWYKFLDLLNTYESDKSGLNGHDRIVNVLRGNLGSKDPLPVFFVCHPAKKNQRIFVKIDKPVVFSPQKYLTISIPTASGRETREEIALKVRRRRKR